MSTESKRILLSLAGLAVFLLLAFGSEYSTNKNSSNSGTVGNVGREKTGDTSTYLNSKSGFTGELAENYVDFSFDYPSSWKKDPKAGTGDSPNFVKVEKMSGDITVENFAIGYFTGQRSVMPQLAAQLSEQISGNFPGYKKVSEGETHFGAYDGYEFRFTSHTDEVNAWGRVILLPGAAGRKGASIIMIATSKSADVHGLDDVGEKGELPIIVKSFKFAE
jgi:hypothetical protein